MTLTKAQIERDAIEARKLANYVAKVQRLLGHLVSDRLAVRLINEAYAEGKTAEAYAAEVAAQEPVGRAVHPLKVKAVEAAGQRARGVIEKVRKNLAEGDWDMQKVAPYPNRLSVWSNEYRQAKARHALYSSLTKDDPAARNTHRSEAPRIVIMSKGGCDRFVAMSEEMAAAQYDAFICKLVDKVGEVTSADLEGNHVWQHSILTVRKPDGSVEKWKTQQIWNVSSLGNPYQQWPTRLVK